MFGLWFEHLADSCSSLFSSWIKYYFNIRPFSNYVYMTFWEICPLNFRIPVKYLNSFVERKPNPIKLFKVFNTAMFCLWFEHIADSCSFLFPLQIKYSFNIWEVSNYMYNYLAFRKRNTLPNLWYHSKEWENIYWYLPVSS